MSITVCFLGLYSPRKRQLLFCWQVLGLSVAKPYEHDSELDQQPRT